jgi:ribosomal protein S18 acetylase RimI-like enzyme
MSEHPIGAPQTGVERLDTLRSPDLHDLCDAAEAAIVQGGGFGWLKPPPRTTMETYWKGILLVPERDLFVCRLDGVIAGSAQLVRPAPNNEAAASSGQLTTFFVAPWARGYGLALHLVQEVEAAARAAGLKILNLDVRETQSRAIQIYEQLGFVKWGSHPHYALVDGKWLTGHYYYKVLNDETGTGG